MQTMTCALIVVGLSGTAMAQSAGPAAQPGGIPAAARPAARVSDTATWQKRVMEELQRRKRYPATLSEAARTAGEEAPSGKATLAFALDRTGKVVEASISVSSGRPEFDAAVLAMAPLGAIFAPPPSNLGDEQRIKLSVPVNFVGVRRDPEPPQAERRTVP